jgi:hypothetical protein
LSVDLLGFGAQSSDGQDLAVLDDALLELAKQDSESWFSNMVNRDLQTLVPGVSLPAA